MDTWTERQMDRQKWKLIRGLCLQIRNTHIYHIYSFQQLLTFGHVKDFSFSQFSPFLQKNLETNDTSFESPEIEDLDSGKKLGVAVSRALQRPLNPIPHDFLERRCYMTLGQYDPEIISCRIKFRQL